MKKIFLLTCLLFYGIFLIAQTITVSPSVTTEQCPEVNVNLQFNFGNFDASKFSIITDGLKGCAIVSNINSSGFSIVKFSDKKEQHELVIRYTPLSNDPNTYNDYPFKFTKIKTLDGLKPTWPIPIPPIVHPVPPYDDYLNNQGPVVACATNTFRYTCPEVKFKDASNVEYGLGMGLAEWLAPKGWKINGNVSDGINPIATAGGPSADITPDPYSSGEIKFRVKNICNPNTLKKSNWYVIFVDRPIMRLLANGQNPVNINCGDQNDIIFSLQNIHQFSCFTAFEWQIGANWLLPNGSPAPSVISNNSSTLTLKPSGNGAPGAVLLKVLMNGVPNLNTFNCPVNFTLNAPQLEITGDANICEGQKTYTLTGQLSAVSNLSWTANPASKVNLVPFANAVDVQKIGNGSTILTATVNACGVSFPYTKFIQLGVPEESAYWIDVFGNGSTGDPMRLCPNTNYNIEANFYNPYPEYEWMLPDGWISAATGTSGPFVTNSSIISATSPSFDYGGWPYVRVRAKNECGFSESTFLQLGLNCSPYGGKLFFDVAPNPARNEIKITANALTEMFKPASPKNQLNKFVKVMIFDATGNVKLQKTITLDNTIFSMDVSSLKPGTYTITLAKDDKKYSKVFFVVR